MALYEDDSKASVEEKTIYKTIQCYECGKYAGLYFRKNPTFFEELFFCSLACESKHQKKKKAK